MSMSAGAKKAPTPGNAMQKGLQPKLMVTKPEINEHALKLIIGLIALFLANLTAWLAVDNIPSISASYYTTDNARNVFVGLLFTISAFLFAYNGHTVWQMFWSKVAAVAAIGIAVFPCDCIPDFKGVPYVHYISAMVMFLILAYFCKVFHDRAVPKIPEEKQARWRATIYSVCGWIILLAMAVLLANVLSGEAIQRKVPRIVFHGEWVALIAFGISWLVSSRAIRGITGEGKRALLLPPVVKAT